jgi:nucleoid DNA-binding protein
MAFQIENKCTEQLVTNLVLKAVRSFMIPNKTVYLEGFSSFSVHQNAKGKSRGHFQIAPWQVEGEKATSHSESRGSKMKTLQARLAPAGEARQTLAGTWEPGGSGFSDTSPRGRPARAGVRTGAARVVNEGDPKTVTEMPP